METSQGLSNSRHERNARPKLKEGDQQVPEGIYRIESLNPNSLYHLALRVNYPNQEDRRRAIEDGRKEPAQTS